MTQYPPNISGCSAGECSWDKAAWCVFRSDGAPGKQPSREPYLFKIPNMCHPLSMHSWCYWQSEWSSCHSKMLATPGNQVWDYHNWHWPAPWQLSECNAPSANSPLHLAALALRFLLGAPVTRNRVFFLIVRKNLMVRNLDLSLFAKGMYENLQLPQTTTWYCPQIRMLFMLSVQSWMHVYPSVVSLTYLAQSFTKARSSPAKGPLGCGRICDYYQEEGEQNASWSM